MAESAYLVTSISRSNTHVTTLSFYTTKLATWVKSYDPSMANVPYFALQVPCESCKIYTVKQLMVFQLYYKDMMEISVLFITDYPYHHNIGSIWL